MCRVIIDIDDIPIYGIQLSLLFVVYSDEKYFFLLADSLWNLD